jgi:hypothetical protein
MDRTRDFPACSAVPQQTVPPAACPITLVQEENPSSSAEAYSIELGQKLLIYSTPHSFQFSFQFLRFKLEF